MSPRADSGGGIAGAVRRRPLAVAALLLAAVKALQYAVDSTPLFYYDSGSFLMNALGRSFVPERSYTYSFLIRLFCVPFESLQPLVVLQAVAGAVTGWLLAFVLIRYFEVRAWVALLAALAFAVDPSQVLHERMVMTETVTLLVFALMLVAALEYLRRPSILLLVVAAFLGTVLASLRVVHVPVVWSAAVLIPLAAAIRWRHVRFAGLAVMVSCGATLLFHTGYRSLTGVLSGHPPAYHYRDGFFLASAVAPLIRPGDAEDPRVAVVVEQQMHGRLALADRMTRNDQMWEADGLRRRIEPVYAPDKLAANDAARRLARRAILRDPAGFLQLGLRSYGDYWRDTRRLIRTLRTECGLGREPLVLPATRALILSRFGLNVEQSHKLPTPSRAWLRVGAAWCYVLLIAPGIGLLAVWLSAPKARVASGLLAAWSCLLMAATILGGITVCYRFLHPFSFLCLAAMAVIAESGLRRRERPVKGGLGELEYGEFRTERQASGNGKLGDAVHKRPGPQS